MWDFDECRRRRRGCKSGILVDRVAMKTSCSECGLDYGLGDCGLSTVTTDPNSSDLGNLQSRGSNSLAAEPNNESSDDLLADDQADLQNLGPDPVSLASMSER